MNMPHSKVFDHITSNFRYHDFYKIETTLMYTQSFFYVLFYGLKDLDRRKRKKTVKEGIGCVINF